jgi:hypothetical protein
MHDVVLILIVIGVVFTALEDVWFAAGAFAAAAALALYP